MQNLFDVTWIRAGERNGEDRIIGFPFLADFFFSGGRSAYGTQILAKNFLANIFVCWSSSLTILCPFKLDHCFVNKF